MNGFLLVRADSGGHPGDLLIPVAVDRKACADYK